jgi:hypothetical protein
LVISPTDRPAALIFSMSFAHTALGSSSFFFGMTWIGTAASASARARVWAHGESNAQPVANDGSSAVHRDVPPSDAAHAAIFSQIFILPDRR